MAEIKQEKPSSPSAAGTQEINNEVASLKSLATLNTLHQQVAPFFPFAVAYGS